MEYVFVTTSHDYADEFDVSGTFTAEKTELDKQLFLIEKAFEVGALTYDTEFYFGTNEALRFDDYATFMRGVKIKPCSEAFHNEYFELTAGSCVGIDIIGQIVDYINEQIEEAKE